jgi:CRP/FNR family transcriptional regulator
MGGMISPELLSKLPIFASLEPRHVEALSRLSVVRAYDRGECVFLEGEPLPVCFHVLMAGTLQIVKISLSGKETAIRLIRPGELFAWAALLDTGMAPATARAMTPSRVLKVPRDALMQLLSEDPAVALKLLATLSERLRDVHEQLHAVVSERARTRLARLILRHQQREGLAVQTPLPHQVLARMAGITYEESVRIVGEWSHGETPMLAYRRGGHITVLDAQRLAVMAEGLDETALSGV